MKILIQDDGKGIPRAILDKLGSQGFSYGKESFINSGTGLGISHAIKVINSFGGLFLITSELSIGTTVTIKLPKSDIPNWFVEKLSVDQAQQVIVLDDDQSIYNLWRDRFSRLPKKYIKLIHFSNGELFRDYFLKTLKLNYTKTLFLIDFELLNQPTTGLDLIEELGLAKQAILVTSHYEDADIKARANLAGVRMIPKGIAAFVPIN